MAGRPLQGVEQPRPIQRLDEEVVNKIAAGEIIQRPANAIKELLENSLDAGATSIKISVKEGGIKQLQIQDNGSGIRKDDLPLLCERFTTSKIRHFDDISKLQTYGFRGEALASVSQVAHLFVTTKTASSATAFKAEYAEGRLVGDVKVCAGNQGTALLIEDMFYNMPQRRKGLRVASDEYAKILDVVTKYAVHNEGVSFSCKKAASTSPDLSTSASATTVETIGAIYTEQLKRDLVRLECSSKEYQYECEGYVSSPNWHAKKGGCLLFINHRLVDCAPLKKALELTYSTLLPKACSPWIYLSLTIPPANVDPNVHPNKREVRFLNEDEIVEGVCEGLRRVLVDDAEKGRRVENVQTLLPGAPLPSLGKGAALTPASDHGTPTPTGKAAPKVLPQKMIRTDHTARTLDALLASSYTPPALTSSGKRKGGPDDVMETDATGPARAIKDAWVGAAANIPESACSLTSIRTLRKQVKEGVHRGLKELVKQHIFVGAIDMIAGLSAVQYQTELFSVLHTHYCDEMFYQLGLRQFGAMPRFMLDPPPSLSSLVEIAIEVEDAPELDQFGRPAAVEKICNIILSRREMLDEYFSLGFDDEGKVISLPILLPGYRPYLERLPLFLMRMAVACDWTDEMRCFATFLHELAFFHLPAPVFPYPEGYSGPIDAAVTKELEESDGVKELKVLLGNVVFPAMKRYLEPSDALLEATTQLASLPSLYKVFERFGIPP